MTYLEFLLKQKHLSIWKLLCKLTELLNILTLLLKTVLPDSINTRESFMLVSSEWSRIIVHTIQNKKLSKKSISLIMFFFANNDIDDNTVESVKMWKALDSS